MAKTETKKTAAGSDSAKPKAAPKAKAAPKKADAKSKTEPKPKAAAKPKAEAKPKDGTGRVNALQKPLKPSDDLKPIVGDGDVTRTAVVSKMWEYIRNNKLQNPENKREILADDKLKKVFGKDKVTMFEMNKLLSKHLT